jgi:hypothetical protein
MKLTFQFPDWEPQYKATFLEVDKAKLLERIAAAEAAIHRRIQAMLGRNDGVKERQAIGKALSALSVLKETNFV